MVLKCVSVVRLVRVSKVTVEAGNEEEVRVALSVAFTAVELITSGSKEGERRSMEDEMSASPSERVTTRLLVSSTVV